MERELGRLLLPISACLIKNTFRPILCVHREDGSMSFSLNRLGKLWLRRSQRQYNLPQTPANPEIHRMPLM